MEKIRSGSGILCRGHERAVLTKVAPKFAKELRHE